MKPTKHITAKYKQGVIRFDKSIKHLHSPIVSAVLKNLETGVYDLTANDFLIDTGADISLINRKYESFVKNLVIIERINIKYGGGATISCPVYKIGIQIKGEEIETMVAYDENCPCLVLGRYDFLENFTYVVFENNNKKIRLTLN